MYWYSNKIHRHQHPSPSPLTVTLIGQNFSHTAQPRMSLCDVPTLHLIKPIVLIFFGATAFCITKIWLYEIQSSRQLLATVLFSCKSYMFSFFVVIHCIFLIISVFTTIFLKVVKNNELTLIHCLDTKCGEIHVIVSKYITWLHCFLLFVG